MPLAQEVVDDATKWTGDWTDPPFPGLVTVTPANNDATADTTKPTARKIPRIEYQTPAFMISSTTGR